MPASTPLRRLIAAALLYMGAFAALRILVTYRALQIGASDVDIGVIAAAFSLLPLVFAFSLGRLADRVGARPLLVAALLLSAAGTGFAAVGSSIAAIAAANAVIGFGQLLAIIGGQTCVMEVLGRDRYVAGFAGFTLAVSIGQTVATPAIGLQLGHESAATVALGPAFAVCAGALCLALPLAVSLPRWSPPDSPDDPAGPGRTRFLDILLLPGMRPATFSSLVVLSSIELVTAYLPVIGDRAGLSTLTVSLLLTLRSLAAVVSRALMPVLLRFETQSRLLVWCPVVTTPALVAMGAWHSPWALGAALLVVGFWWGVNQPLTMAWIAQIAPTAERSAAMSLRLLGNRVGQVLVPIGAGATAGVLGAGSVFFVAGALSAVSVVSTARGVRSAPPEPAPEAESGGESGPGPNGLSSGPSRS